jgi:predicted TIM-barrel fold metal-dependent hydrolase
MQARAIDIHSHYHTGDRVKNNPKLASRSDADRRAEFIEYYRSRDMLAVVFDVDRETHTGEQADNNEIAALVSAAEGRLIAFATVDPWRQRRALLELERCLGLGFRGLKVQPITQQFDVSDRRFYPIWDFCQQNDWPVLVHTGTTAVGAGTPGGNGLKIKYGRPVPNLDDVAADFPRLRLIAAHFGWPWHLELMAVARHKKNVFVDLSGWAPKLIPAEVLQYCDKVIPEQFVFGSDYPMLSVDRWMAEFEELDLKDSTRQGILFDNAARLLGISS